MLASAWPEALTAAGVGVATLGVILGVPAWKLANRALRTQEHAQETQRIAQVVKQVMVGEGTPPPRSPEHPSLVDLMERMEETNQETSWLVSVVAWHISDGHGGRIPPGLTGSQPRR